MSGSLFWGSLVVVPLGLLVFSLLTLFFERKFIAVAQKRLGISFLGRNGWAHLPADLVKFWLKYTGRHHGSWLSASAGVVGAILAYLVWSLLGCAFFLSDGASAVVDFWDYQLLAYFGYANLTTLAMFHVIAGLKSKYATIAAARVLLLGVTVEVFFALCFLALYAHGGGYGFEELASANQALNLSLALPPLAAAFFLYALFEAKRAPFDHSEAESELVAGHLVEFGGRALLFFFMCEYAHVYFCMYLILFLCLGAPSPSAALGTWPYWADQAGAPLCVGALFA